MFSMSLLRTSIFFRSSLLKRSPQIAPRCTPRRLLSSHISDRSPLKIIFCGSDNFSVASLRALYRAHVEHKDIIASIDVLCKVDKPTGRGGNTVKEVPLKSVARSLSLPIHEVDRFKDWNLPEASAGGKINLIVAVSFGLLIPNRVIAEVKYGGINVHPSLLPMYRGPAPIHHTLLDSAPITGVTVQTLHPSLFDRGTLLLQTNPPFNVPPRTSYQDLHDTLAANGAELLVKTCLKGLFIPPIKPVSNNYEPSVAPKIDYKIDKRINFCELSAEEVERKAAALRSVWCRFGPPEEPQLVRRYRATLSDVSWLDVPEEKMNGVVVPPGTFEYLRVVENEDGPSDKLLAIKCKKGGGWIRVGGIQVEGKNLVNGEEWARSMRDKNKEPTLRMFL